MECMKTLRVSPKGQISIPKEARDSLGIKTGENLVMFVSSRGIFIEKSRALLENRIAAWECMLASEDVLKKDWDNKYDDRWNKY
jgi:AbrB family looped-hinge helix DNA binding protein